MLRANASWRAFSGLGFETVRWLRSDTYLPLAAIGLRAMPKSARGFGRLKLPRQTISCAVGELDELTIGSGCKVSAQRFAFSRLLPIFPGCVIQRSSRAIRPAAPEMTINPMQ